MKTNLFYARFAKLTVLVMLASAIGSGCTSIAKTIVGTTCAPVYGNWCGENYPLAGFDPPPVDDWDRVCRDHDKCYDRGGSKAACDDKMVAQLESLSRRQLAPQRMHNAHAFFSKYGYKSGWFQFTDEVWSIAASCEGGDGRRAEFHCAVNAWNGCALRSTSGPGRAGMGCNCSGFPGVIVER